MVLLVSECGLSMIACVVVDADAVAIVVVVIIILIIATIAESV